MLRKIKNKLRYTAVGKLYGYFTLRKLFRKKVETFNADLANFRLSEGNTNLRFGQDYDHYPLLDDRTSITEIEPHYTYHPAWAARILAKTQPKKHVDISSILHFSTIVSAFIPVEFYDYRPAKIKLEGLDTKHADLTQLPFRSNTIDSLSCLHTLEHIGLGRYGDEIDYDGDLKAINELIRVLAVNGNLLIVTPIGKAKIAFNAHRIYAYDQIISYFSKLELIEFSLIPDRFENIGMIRNASKKQADEQNWGCGCFWFKKSLNDQY
ncbi:hypothetical protein GCM10022289_03760 [Pedobacter jeongneungensis]|uniref:DUF268 domain-containing protein n=1 Tax=Pedobacter jeongneungensis TaxID=947309 RepID=A0ABP8B3B8_9SPHI